MKKAIAVLTKGYIDHKFYKDLIKRNKSIERNLKTKCSMLIFHEGNINSSQQKMISSKTNLNLEFIPIPPFKPIPNLKIENYGQGWGYRHMCNFWFIGFLEYTKKYDLLIRIDEDCEISFSIDRMFDLLEKKACVYGTWFEEGDERLTKGLLDYFKDFFQEENFSTLSDNSGPYTNVIGFNLMKIREKKLLSEFQKKLKNDNLIFIRRWGDLPLWGATLRVLFKKDEYEELDFITYFHSSHSAMINPKFSILLIKKYLKTTLKKLFLLNPQKKISQK